MRVLDTSQLPERYRAFPATYLLCGEDGYSRIISEIPLERVASLEEYYRSRLWNERPELFLDVPEVSQPFECGCEYPCEWDCACPCHPPGEDQYGARPLWMTIVGAIASFFAGKAAAAAFFDSISFGREKK